MPPPLPPVVYLAEPPATVVQALAAAGVALADAPSPGVVAVVGGTAGERVGLAREAIGAGAHVLLAWPPGVSLAEADALAGRADEAGVEVGAMRPLPVAGLLAGMPAGWVSRLTTLAVETAHTSDLAGLRPTDGLAGALDVCAALARTSDDARVEAAADGALTAVSVRFRTGAVAHVSLRADVPATRFRLVASGGGALVEARALGGPLCVDGRDAPVSERPYSEAMAFVRAMAEGQRAPYTLDDALAVMRLVEQVRARLR